MRNRQTEIGMSDSTARSTIGRREFIGAAAGAFASAAVIPHVAGAPGAPRVAFNTANLVARVTRYRFELRNWMDQHKKTVAATDAAAWREICREIAGAGYKAVEIWEAHASPGALGKYYFG